MSKGLSESVKEMEQIKTIEIGDNSYQLEYFLGGDWKFLASVCGIGGANADFACIWCKCPKAKRYDVQQNWSILDPELGGRTIDKVQFHQYTIVFIYFYKSCYRHSSSLP